MAVHFLSVSGVPQSASPWTNGGLCDVCQPSHGIFPLMNRFNPLVNRIDYDTHQYARRGLCEVAAAVASDV